MQYLKLLNHINFHCLNRNKLPVMFKYVTAYFLHQKGKASERE